jgi:hypothetical protein
VNHVARKLDRRPGGSGNFENFALANFALVGLGLGAGSATIAEATIYDRLLTTEERETLELALGDRYGISLD